MSNAFKFDTKKFKVVSAQMSNCAKMYIFVIVLTSFSDNTNHKNKFNRKSIVAKLFTKIFC